LLDNAVISVLWVIKLKPREKNHRKKSKPILFLMVVMRSLQRSKTVYMTFLLVYYYLTNLIKTLM